MLLRRSRMEFSRSLHKFFWICWIRRWTRLIFPVDSCYLLQDYYNPYGCMGF